MKISTYLLTMISIVSFSVFAAERTQPDDDQLLLASCQALTTTPEHDNVSEAHSHVIKTLAKQLPAQINTVKLLRDNILKTLKIEYPRSRSG